MSRMPWATYLWPGLPQLWADGVWAGLALAVGFGVLFNLLLAASLVWDELVAPPQLRWGWGVAGGLWAVAVAISLRSRARRGPSRAVADGEVLFREALSEYLLGNWFEAEAILGRMLQASPTDAEARLLLATLLRHTRRIDAARDQLARLELLRSSQNWKLEIDAERRLLDEWEADQGNQAPDEPPAAAESRQAA